MEIIEVLGQSGLNQKETSVYLALLELGTASVQTISQKAGLKRPTTYLILDDLERKGLVSIVPQKKALYTAESPERLVNDLVKKQELVKRFLPDLLAVYNAKAEKPQVQLFSGREGVNQVYDYILAHDEVDFFGTIGDVVKVQPDNLKEFKRRIKEGTLKSRELFAPTPADIEYAHNMGNLPNYELRFVKEGTLLPTDCALFRDTIALFFYKPQYFVLVIKSKEVFISFKSLYNLAWQAAIPAKEYLTKISPS